MSKEGFINLLKGVRTAYPNFKALDSKEGVQLWYEMLRDIDFQRLSMAFQMHIATSKYPPSIAEIRELATKSLKGSSWSKGWELVNRAVKRFGPNDGKKACEWVAKEDPIGAEALRRLDFKSYSMARVEDVPTIRAQYRMIYEGLSSEKKDLEVLPSGLKEGLEWANELNEDLEKLGQSLSLECKFD